MPRSLRVTCTVFCFAWVAAAGSVFAERPLNFSRDISPILSNNCYLCHGPDANHREGGLRLDDRNVALSKMESGKTAIVPGDAAASHLLERILSSDPDQKMPPAASGKSLTAAEIELLKRWIDEGAEYRGHWSFIPPQRVDPPTVQNTAAVRNEIDRFLVARHEADGLTPNGEADKVTLIRRLTLDLTGLPPTPAEVDAFLADESPEAYERLVDRLLQSPRFGEHFGRVWLDAARYGDTHGLHLDNERSMWPYREWVINAFNRNLPFDQFTIEQLAGDLLPNATIDQQVASGFNRCNVTTSEGGSINEEVLVRYAGDRTETMGTVWLGLTLNCSSCHDHKFDPISQKEFYSLYAFFNSLADNAMDGNALLPPPILKLPSEEQTAQLKQLDADIAAAQQQLTQLLATTDYQDPALGGAPVDALSVLRRDVIWFDDDTPPGAQQQGNTAWEFVTAETGPVHSGTKASKRTASGFSQHFFTGANPPLAIGAGDVLFTYVYLDPANPPKTIMLQFNDGSWEHRAVWGDIALAPWGSDNTPSRRHMGPLPEAGKWVRLEVAADHVGLPPDSKLNGWAFSQHDGTVYWDAPGISTRESGTQPLRSLLAWEDQERSLKEPRAPKPILDIIKLPADQRSDAQRTQLKEHFLRYVSADHRPVFEPLNQKLDALNKAKTDLDGLIPATLVSADLAQPRDAFVLIRGAYNKPGDKVERSVPAIFPGLPEGAPRNRLGLAQWLVSPQHPLTSRVIVNRYWQHYFGTGLVKTAEDFGAQGEWPSHPELLDWLATEFIRIGWDIKEFQKLIVMSAAYRRSAKVTPELLHADPENRLLARGPRFRLDAEVIRDAALFVSGLLVERPGGKSVKPYQPDGLWEAVAFVGSNTSKFTQDNGAALYRRSLYTFWKRTSPPPSMLTFDAPSRENCTVRRSRTNTPLQSLALMNDVQYVEASRKLAERMMLDGGSQPVDRLEWGFRLVTGRKPTDPEREILRTTYESQLARYAADPAAADQLLTVGSTPRDATLAPAELAAYTMIGNVLLNLDEAVTKE